MIEGVVINGRSEFRESRRMCNGIDEEATRERLEKFRCLNISRYKEWDMGMRAWNGRYAAYSGGNGFYTDRSGSWGLLYDPYTESFTEVY